jgi:hypothetical protein
MIRPRDQVFSAANGSHLNHSFFPCQRVFVDSLNCTAATIVRHNFDDVSTESRSTITLVRVVLSSISISCLRPTLQRCFSRSDRSLAKVITAIVPGIRPLRISIDNLLFNRAIRLEEQCLIWMITDAKIRILIQELRTAVTLLKVASMISSHHSI